VHVLSLVNVEGFVVDLEGDAVALLFTDHHLTATHEVVHHVLQGWFESLQVDRVEVDVA
jgi:hypothetical protein